MYPEVEFAFCNNILLLYSSIDYLGLGLLSEYGLDGQSIENSFIMPNAEIKWYAWLLKLIFTVITLSTGFKGGEITPLFFIGTTLGGALTVFLDVPAAAHIFSACGFVAVFAAAYNTPISGFVLGIEYFGGNYPVYLGVSCLVAYLFSGKSALYSSQKLELHEKIKMHILPSWLDFSASVKKDGGVATRARVRSFVKKDKKLNWENIHLNSLTPAKSTDSESFHPDSVKLIELAAPLSPSVVEPRFSNVHSRVKSRLIKAKNFIFDRILVFVHFFAWIIYLTPACIFTGIICALFLKALAVLTDLRYTHPWLIFLLPLSGMLIVYVYSRFGKGCVKGTNLVLDEIYAPRGPKKDRGSIPIRMAPMILWSTLVTHLFGGSSGREGTAIQIAVSIMR